MLFANDCLGTESCWCGCWDDRKESWMYSHAKCELLNYEWHCGILWGLRPLNKAVLGWEFHQDCVSGWEMPPGWAWAGLNAGNGDEKSKCRGRAGGHGAQSLKVPPVHRAVTKEGASGFQVSYAQFHRGHIFKASIVSSPALTVNGRQTSLGLERGRFPYISQCQMTVESLPCILHLLRKSAYELESGENLAKQSIYLMNIRMLRHIGNEGPEEAESWMSAENETSVWI